MTTPIRVTAKAAESGQGDKRIVQIWSGKRCLLAEAELRPGENVAPLLRRAWDILDAKESRL